jgi:hypothetical protein
MKSLIPCLVTVVALLSAVPARSAGQEKTPQEIEILANELVRKLGNSKYREREAASRELAKLGLDARKAIEEGRNNPDPEIAARCESLIPFIRMLDLKRRVEEFAADPEGRLENTLPLGATYEKICGKDENARKFFIELCRNHLAMLDDAANNPETTGESYFGLVCKIVNRRDGVSCPVTGGAALLLIAADEKIGPSIDEANLKQEKGGDRNYQRFIGSLWTPEYEAVMIDPNNGRYFRKLLFAWAKRLPEPLAMQSFMFFIKDMINKQVMNLQSDSDTLEFLMHFAASTSAQRLPYQKGEAMSIVAGASISKNDLIAFFEEKLLKDETTLEPVVGFDLNDGTTIKVETRACDYALAVCVKLSGQSFQDYGFDILGSHSDKFDSWMYAGFTKDETRQAAFKKYEEWRKANPIQKD